MRFYADRIARLGALLSALVLLTTTGHCQEKAKAAKPPPAGYAITGGKVFPVSSDPIDHGVVLVKGRKIEKVGTKDAVSIPDGYEVIDATGHWVVPGFIELHNHTTASDLHDIVYQVNPELRVLDNIEWDTPSTKISVAGGVTTVLVIPGSGTNMGGFGVTMKTYGKSPEEVIVRYPGALKIAQAGNPERYQGDLGHSRMGMNWMIRNVLVEGKAYHEAWCRYERGETKTAPEKNLRYEELRGLYRGEYPCAVHTQFLQVVQSTMRILHDELKLKVVIDHACFDSYILGPELAKRQIPSACGPRIFFLDQQQGKFIGTASGMYWLGVSDDLIGVNTDSPNVPQEELPFQGTMAIRHGVPEKAMLRGLTINAARMLNVDDRLGSLEAGKDADIALWTGDPFDPRNFTRVVMVNGEIAYDLARDGQRF